MGNFARTLSWVFGRALLAAVFSFSFDWGRILRARRGLGGGGGKLVFAFSLFRKSKAEIGEKSRIKDRTDEALSSAFLNLLIYHQAVRQSYPNVLGDGKGKRRGKMGKLRRGRQKDRNRGKGKLRPKIACGRGEKIVG